MDPAGEPPVNLTYQILSELDTETMEHNQLYVNLGVDGGFQDGGDYLYMDGINGTEGEIYDNPFDLPAVRIIFILLYCIVFACCFFGEYFQSTWVFFRYSHRIFFSIFHNMHYLHALTMCD